MKESRTILYYPQITEGKGEHSELLDYYREFSDSDPVPDPVPDLDKLLKSKVKPTLLSLKINPLIPGSP